MEAHPRYQVGAGLLQLIRWKFQHSAEASTGRMSFRFQGDLPACRSQSAVESIHGSQASHHVMSASRNTRRSLQLAVLRPSSRQRLNSRRHHSSVSPPAGKCALSQCGIRFVTWTSHSDNTDRATNLTSKRSMRKHDGGIPTWTFASRASSRED
jgi:hypothetical protein